MELSVDRTRCQGHARCAMEAPDFFDLDEAGYVVAASSSVPADQEKLVFRAVKSCPEQALSIGH